MADRIRTGTVEIIGLGDLNRALKELGPQFKGQMRKTNKVVANFVASDARSAAQAQGGVLAHMAPSIKATAGATSAGVSLGGPAHPEGPGAEFGGGRRATTQQFQPWRGTGAGAGYAVYPSIRRDEDRIQLEYLKGADALIRKAGLA